MNQKKQFIELGRAVIDMEALAVAQLGNHIDDNFAQACELMYQACNRIIVIGMGKSGHIGKKFAATLASTGSPAFFVHPGEASHGDLGMIAKNDVLVLISNSGETPEIIALLPALKRLDNKIISLTGKTDSTLAQQSDVVVNVGVSKEACPLGLAPTSSTTATLAMTDALAVAILEAKGFSKDDFALSHPGGNLGKRLLLRVSDIMHSGDMLPLVTENMLLSDALVEISSKKLGMAAVVDANNKLLGLFTDGDLRRAITKKIDIHSTIIKDVCTQNCKTVQAHELAAHALKLMQQHKINGLIVVDSNNTVVGAFNMVDLLQAGIV